MSNLYKGNVNQNKGDVYTRVIDYNDLLEQKLTALSFEQQARIHKEQMEQAAEDGEQEPGGAEGTAPEKTFSSGLFAASIEVAPEMEIDYVEHAKEQAAEIVAKATADAEEILKKAVEEAERLKEKALEEATDRGYADGMAHARAEEDQMRAGLDQMRMEQEQEYTQRLRQMEPELMDVIIHVFDNVLQTDLAKRRAILLHLIRSTVQEIKSSREFRIRVSPQDYGTISENRQEIIQKIGGEVALDIVSDDSMQPGQCIIDTDEGIFDCGLDVQMENLINDIKALSCMEENG